MRYSIITILLITVWSCDKVEPNVSASINGHFQTAAQKKKGIILRDSTFLPTVGNGIKHFVPQGDFRNNFRLFKSLLQHFKYESLPYNLDALIVDKTTEEWEKERALSSDFLLYLLDNSAFEAAAKMTNPRESLSDFYKIHPIAKFNEIELFHTLLYLVRYLDGNGQQDVFYLTTFSNEGVLLSGVEIGALEASAETYIRTAQIKSKNYIKVHHADYDETINDWIKTSESEYFLDNTGQVYANFENVSLRNKEGERENNHTIENRVSTVKMNEFANYFQLFQKELRNDEPQGILKYITFPHFRVSYEEHFQDFRSKDEFILQYPIIFNEDFRKKIMRQKFDDLIVNNDEIGLSDGSIWFKRIGRDNDGKLVVAIRVN